MKITKKNLNILIESFLKEEEKDDKSLKFTLTLETNPPIEINFSTEKDENNNYHVPVVNSKDENINKIFLKGDPVDRLVIAIEKLKQLLQTGENKKLAADIAEFIKNYDTSIDQDLTSPEEILNATKKHERILNIAIDKISKSFKGKDNKNLLS